MIFKHQIELETMYERVVDSGWFILSPLKVISAGQPHEQTMFSLEDPSHNLLQFSCYTHPSEIYAQPVLS